MTITICIKNFLIQNSQGRISPYKFLVPCLSVRVNSQTNKLMEKSRTLGTKMVFVCYLLLKEANTHINLICFDDNFDHPHVNVVTFVPRKQSKKPQFFHKILTFC